MATKPLSPLLSTMSKAARTAFPFIQRAVREGLESEKIIEAMREAGIPTFRRQDMLALIREASGAELLKSDIARWPKEFVLPFNRVRTAVTKIVAPISYTVKLTIVDPETGALRTMLRQAHSQTLRSFKDVAARFLAGNVAAYEELDVQDAEVIDVIHAGDQGVL